MDNYNNGNLKDMTELIDEYGLYDYFADLKTFLYTEYELHKWSELFNLYSDIVIKYHRIKYR